MALWDRRSTFDRQLKEHLPRAMRFAVRLTGDIDVAEEVVQEAMVRAARSWKTYRGEASFRSWLYRIVVNTFRDRLARGTSTRELAEEPIDAKGREPSELAMARELGELVAVEVSALPPRQREVMVLSAFEAMEAREIAAVLRVSEESVYSNLHLARNRLRQRLARYLAEK